MISDWPTSQTFSTSVEWSAFLSTLCFHVLCLSWCIFFCHRAILPHLIPWLYALQIPRVSKSHLLSEDLLDDPWCWNQNSLFLIPTTSQDINYYCVILSLNLPTGLESGLLEGVNCRTACAQLVSVTPGLWLWDESDLSSHKSSVPTRVFAYPSSWLSTKPWDQRGLSLPSFPRWGIQALWECVPCRRAPAAERINQRQSNWFLVRCSPCRSVHQVDSAARVSTRRRLKDRSMVSWSLLTPRRQLSSFSLHVFLSYVGFSPPPSSSFASSFSPSSAQEENESKLYDWLYSNAFDKYPDKD